MSGGTSPSPKPILKGYPRPKAATPLYAPLVPAYQPCTAGTSTKTHAPPLAYGSCTAAQTSDQLTAGSFDANAKAANSTGYIRMVRLGDLTTPADTVLPGIAPENKRAIWQTDQVKVCDGGPDGDADTADNSLFMVQGVFAPWGPAR